MKKMNIIEKLTKLGYDAPDIHWLHSFYTIGLNVTSPNTDQRRIQDQRDLENAAALQKLVNGGDRFYIDQAVNYGRVGLTFMDVKFKTPETQKEIRVTLPRGFMNAAITSDNYLVADTNNSAKWDTLKFPLPSGKWTIYAYAVTGGAPNKKDVILKNINEK